MLLFSNLGSNYTVDHTFKSNWADASEGQQRTVAFQDFLLITMARISVK